MKYILFTLLISISCFAYTNKQLIQDSNGDHYILSYSENNKFIFDHIFIENGKLQELKTRKFFNTKEQLINFKRRFIKHNFNEKPLISMKKRSKRTYIHTEIKSQSIWEVKNNWSLEWENSYAKWIKEEFNENFFIKYNLPTDCADVAFALRWIFARNNNLPAANTLAGSHIIFSQDSVKAEWLNLPKSKLWHEDKMFLAALNYLMLHAYTGTLNIDGYPIELNRDSFLEGTIHLDGGHTMIISKIDYSNKLSAPIYKLSSTVPAQVRTLQKEIMIDQEITFKDNGGLFRMRWPMLENGNWKLKAKREMPLYSLEQYSKEFLGDETSFTLALIDRLGINFIPKKIVNEAIKTIKSNLKERISIVEDAYNFCKNNNCEEGTLNYEEYSTPTRDKRIRTKFRSLSKLTRQFTSFDKEIKSYLIKKLKTESFTVNGITKSIFKYRILFEKLLLSYEPKDSIDKRWALSSSAMLETIDYRFIQKKKKREELVKQASFCNKNNCKKGTENFKKYNTYKFDSELKSNILLAYDFIKNTLKTKSVLDRSILSIPFYNSNPYAKKRWGDTRAQDYFILSGKEIKELNQGYIWTDGEIFSTRTKLKSKFQVLGEYSFFHSPSEKLFSFKDKTLYIYNITGELLLTRDFPYPISELIWLSENYFTLELEIPTTEDNLYIFKFQNNSLKKIETLSNGVLQSHEENNSIKRVEVIDSKTMNIGFSYTENQLFYVENNILKKRQMSFQTRNNHGDILLYVQKEGTLNIENLKTKTNCSINIPKDHTNWSLTEDPFLILLDKYDEENDQDFARIYRLKDCTLTPLLTFNNSYPEIRNYKGISIVRAYSERTSSRQLYAIDKDKIIKIPSMMNSFLFSVDFNNKDFYISKYGNNNLLQSGYKFNLKTQQKEELPESMLYSFCSKADALSLFCSEITDARVESFIENSLELMTIYTSLSISKDIELSIYIEQPTQSFYESFSNISLKSYRGIKLVNDSYLLIKN